MTIPHPALKELKKQAKLAKGFMVLIKKKLNRDQLCRSHVFRKLMALVYGLDQEDWLGQLWWQAFCCWLWISCHSLVMVKLLFLSIHLTLIGQIGFFVNGFGHSPLLGRLCLAPVIQNLVPISRRLPRVLQLPSRKIQILQTPLTWMMSTQMLNVNLIHSQTRCQKLRLALMMRLWTRSGIHQHQEPRKFRVRSLIWALSPSKGWRWKSRLTSWLSLRIAHAKLIPPLNPRMTSPWKSNVFRSCCVTPRGSRWPGSLDTCLCANVSPSFSHHFHWPHMRLTFFPPAHATA